MLNDNATTADYVVVPFLLLRELILSFLQGGKEWLMSGDIRLIPEDLLSVKELILQFAMPEDVQVMHSTTVGTIGPADQPIRSHSALVFKTMEAVLP